MTSSKRESSKQSNDKATSRKATLRKATFTASYTEKPSQPKRQPVTHKKVNRSAEKKTATQKSKGRDWSQPFYKTQAEYMAAKGDDFDLVRAEGNAKADNDARNHALETLKAQDCKVERNVELRSTPEGSPGANSVVDDPVLLRNLHLDRTDEDHNLYLSKIRNRPIRQCEEPYPPYKEFVSESLESKEYWEKRWKYTPLKDGRGQRWMRLPVTVLDRSKMTVVRANESVIFHEPLNPSRLVLVVLRGVVRDVEVLRALSVLCVRATVERRDIRRDDIGTMINLGHTAGSIHKPRLGIAKNWLSKDPSLDDAHHTQDLEEGGWLTLLWNIILKSLPKVITDDYKGRISASDLPHLPTYRKEEYQVKLGDRQYHFTTGEQAPSSAIAAWNYSKSTHTDFNANDWMVSYTCHSNADPARGGNFYLAKYGILVEQASNSCVAWMTKDEHGTTLPDDGEGRENYGVSFDLPNKLEVAKRNSEKEAAEKNDDDDDDDDDDFDDFDTEVD